MHCHSVETMKLIELPYDSEGNSIFINPDHISIIIGDPKAMITRVCVVGDSEPFLIDLSVSVVIEKLTGSKSR